MLARGGRLIGVAQSCCVTLRPEPRENQSRRLREQVCATRLWRLAVPAAPACGGAASARLRGRFDWGRDFSRRSFNLRLERSLGGSLREGTLRSRLGRSRNRLVWTKDTQNPMAVPLQPHRTLALGLVEEIEGRSRGVSPLALDFTDCAQRLENLTKVKRPVRRLLPHRFERLP